MSSRFVRDRINKHINALVDQGILTEPGKQWLTIALDPWHDTEVTGLRGLPDEGIGKSVVFQLIQEYSISKNTAPAVLPAGNWKIRVVNYPFIGVSSDPEGHTMSPGLSYGDIITQDNTTTLLVPVQVNYAADGVDFTDTAVSGLSNAQGCNLPSTLTKGTFKVIAMGIEIVNTTAVLNKQGLMTCVRMNQPDSEGFTPYVSLSTPANAWTLKTMFPLRTPPKNLAEMAYYPGFTQDEAKDGYYAPVILKLNRDTHYPTGCGLLLMDDDSTASYQFSNPVACHSSKIVGRTVAGNTSTFYTNGSNVLYVPQNSNVVMMTGLSDETTLTLRVRWVVERFPSDAESDILPIATPTAPYDPFALEIYSRVVQKMPAGVPFTENPMGEWWNKMLDVIEEYIAPAVAAIPHPIAQAVSPILGKAKTLRVAEALPPPPPTNDRKVRRKKVDTTIQPGGTGVAGSTGRGANGVRPRRPGKPARK